MARRAENAVLGQLTANDPRPRENEVRCWLPLNKSVATWINDLPRRDVRYTNGVRQKIAKTSKLRERLHLPRSLLDTAPSGKRRLFGRKSLLCRLEYTQLLKCTLGICLRTCRLSGFTSLQDRSRAKATLLNEKKKNWITGL